MNYNKDEIEYKNNREEKNMGVSYSINYNATNGDPLILISVGGHHGYIYIWEDESVKFTSFSGLDDIKIAILVRNFIENSLNIDDKEIFENNLKHLTDDIGAVLHQRYNIDKEISGILYKFDEDISDAEYNCLSMLEDLVRRNDKLVMRNAIEFYNKKGEKISEEEYINNQDKNEDICCTLDTLAVPDGITIATVLYNNELIARFTKNAHFYIYQPKDFPKNASEVDYFDNVSKTLNIFVENCIDDDGYYLDKDKMRALKDGLERDLSNILNYVMKK